VASTVKKAAPSTVATALVPVLNSVAAAAGGSTGSGLPVLPSLPLPSATGSGTVVPSLPVTTGSGVVPALPSITLPVVGAVTVPVPTVSNTSTSGTCLGVPVPTVVKLPTVSVLGISVGVSTSGSSSDATVCAG
jgi:hypothetical protein